MSQHTTSSEHQGGGVSIEPIEEVILEGLPKEHRASAQKAVSRYVQIVHESYTSPIPPPSVLAQYNDVLDGCANRILTLAEGQQQHRHEMEASVVRSNILNEKLGLGAGFFLAAIITTGSIHLINTGKDVTGLGMIIGEVVVLVGSFYYSQYQKRKERKERIQQLTSQPQKPAEPEWSGKRPRRSKRNK